MNHCYEPLEPNNTLCTTLWPQLRFVPFITRIKKYFLKYQVTVQNNPRNPICRGRCNKLAWSVEWTQPCILPSLHWYAINKCFAWPWCWCPGLFSAPRTRPLSKLSVVRHRQCCGEAGQRSPVELSSGLPSRPLLTVVLLLPALACQPGFRVPLDNQHTQTHTHTHRQEYPWTNRKVTKGFNSLVEKERCRDYILILP